MDGEPVEPREPGAVGDAHSGERNPSRSKRRADDPRACCGRATWRRGRAELLQHHLGREVVALAVQLAHDRRQRLGEVEHDGERSRRSRPRPRPAGHGDPAPLEGVDVGASGSHGRTVDARESHACHGQSRDRPRLDPEVARLPPEPVAPSVEVRVVAEYASRDAPDTGGCELAREPVEVGAIERRVAEADEPEVSPPDAARARPGADDLGTEAMAWAEHAERCERDGKLLGRGRKERASRVRRVDGLPRPEIHGDRRCVSRVDPRSAERVRERGFEVTRCGSRRRSGSAGEGDRDECRDEGGRPSHECTV